VSECPECGLRDDDQFLCRKGSGCFIKQPKVLGLELAEAQQTIAVLKALSEKRLKRIRRQADIIKDYGDQIEALKRELYLATRT